MGGIVAGVLFVLPSLFILIALSWIYIALVICRWCRLVLRYQPAVTAIVVQAAHRIGSRALKICVVAIASPPSLLFSR